jgi:hypothetical protein
VSEPPKVELPASELIPGTEMALRTSFIDFVTGLLNMDPIKRWSPNQAKMHPFITGEKFAGHWEVRNPQAFYNRLLTPIFLAFHRRVFEQIPHEAGRIATEEIWRAGLLDPQCPRLS